MLVASYDTHGLRWDYSYSPVTTRGPHLNTIPKVYRLILKHFLI